MKTIRKKTLFIIGTIVILGTLLIWFNISENPLVWSVRNTIQYHLLVWWDGPFTEPADSESGTLTGVIRTEQGHPIKGAQVLAAYRNGTTFTGITDAGGNYIIKGIPPGLYHPVAGAPGYKSVQFGQLVKGVNIWANAQTTVNAVLPATPPHTVTPGTALRLTKPTTLTCTQPLKSQATRRQIHFNNGGQPNQPIFYYTPVTATATSQLPVLLAIYPGPADTWECASTPLAAAGYAVLAAGPAYTFNLEADLDELERLLTFTRQGRFPGSDGSKLALLGGSYSSLHVQRLLQRGQENMKGALLLGPPTDLFDIRRRLENGTFLPPFGLDKALIAVGLPNEVPLRYWNYSGAYHVRSDFPPLIMFHSRNDEVVPFQQSELLARNLDLVGAPYQLYLFDGSSHYLMSEGGGVVEIFNLSLDFLAKNLK